jgi:hypothetical protein
MILEAYDASGLSRKLTGQDLSALESQAGFPADRGGATVSITESQWREFEAQYHSTLKLLQQISSVGVSRASAAAFRTVCVGAIRTRFGWAGPPWC